MRLALEDTSRFWNYFIVLTYPGEFPCDGRKVKRDIQAFKRWLKRQGIQDIFWGIEFQKRGAPHINILIPESIDKEKLSRAWYRIVGSGDIRHLRAGTGIQEIRCKDKMSSYMIGYVGKREQKDVPLEYFNVGRFWGCTRVIKESGTYTYRFNSPEALNAFIQPIAEHYQSRMDEWSKERKKSYAWKYRGNSFIMWSGSEFIKNYIKGGQQYVSQNSHKVMGEQNSSVLSRRSINAPIPENRQATLTGGCVGKGYRIIKKHHL